MFQGGEGVGYWEGYLLIPAENPSLSCWFGDILSSHWVCWSALLACWLGRTFAFAGLMFDYLLMELI